MSDGAGHTLQFEWVTAWGSLSAPEARETPKKKQRLLDEDDTNYKIAFNSEELGSCPEATTKICPQRILMATGMQGLFVVLQLL